MTLAFLLQPANFKSTDIGAYFPPFATLAVNPALKQVRMNDAKNVVRQLDGDEAVKQFEAFKPVSFNKPHFVPLFDRATTNFAVTQPNGSEKVKRAPITERRNLWNWLPDFTKLASIAPERLSMHTTACASERNWSKRGLMFDTNRSGLSIQRVSQIILLSESHVSADISEGDLIYLSLEDDDKVHPNMYL